MKKIWGVNKRNFYIYLSGLLLSILLIGLYFIDKDHPWCIVCCSVGASLIGAVVLGYCIELGNANSKKEQDRYIYEFSNQKIYSEMNFLLMAVHNAIADIKKIKNEEFRFEGKTLSEIVELFANEIKVIKKDISPVVIAGREVEDKDKEYYRLQQKIKEKIKYHEKVIEASRKEMFSRKTDFINYKTLLLVNNVTTFDEIFAMQSALSVIGDAPLNELTREDELIEMGNSLDELKQGNLIRCFENIGMSKLRYKNQAGYFEIEIEQETKKK